jgi:hypothetical protein
LAEIASKGLSLQHSDDTYDEVNIKMWLVSEPEWVYAGVPFLLDPIGLACHQIAFDTREPSQLQKAAMVGPSVILAISRYLRVVHWSSTQEVAVESVTVFQFGHVWHDGMVKEVLTNMGLIGSALNATLREFLI